MTIEKMKFLELSKKYFNFLTFFYEIIFKKGFDFQFDFVIYKSISSKNCGSIICLNAINVNLLVLNNIFLYF